MKILKYQMMTAVNHGTEEKPDIVQTFHDKTIMCYDASFDANYALALKEAYNGEVTVEDVEEVLTTEQQIAALKEQLSSTDYKIIKCSEAQLVGEAMPYDIAALHAERQAIRDQINELEGGV